MPYKLSVEVGYQKQIKLLRKNNKMVGKYTGFNDPLTKGHLSQGFNT